ncbi:hypothetical protein BDY24DRAFT_418563 [Mrakia frigida]|uniref:uncharacterized protein n=1 Tax=Mrakia frigida TaxID=29902 RepID=UPI003FCBFAEC
MTTPSTLIGKAAVLKDLDSGYEVVDKQAPSPGRGEALVQLNFSGCCYTDTQARFPSPNEPPPRRPHIGGHEGTLASPRQP